MKPGNAPDSKKGDAEFTLPRGSTSNAVETMRRRYLQAELQLREMEDRFRRDCARQERELELLRIENNKFKAKIEEMRMKQTAPKNFFEGENLEDESKLLSASSKKYCMAREAVEAAREELSEIKAKLASTRQRIQDARAKSRPSRTKMQAAQLRSRRSMIELEEQTRSMRVRLRTLESHIDIETEQLSKLVEDAKNIRREIDVQLAEQNRNEDIFRDREKEMKEVMDETSFIIEVCNVLFEERDSCQQQLAELHKASECDHEAYEKTFHELVGVENQDRLSKVRLRENVIKLEEYAAEATKRREAAELALQEETAVFAFDTSTVADENDVKEGRIQSTASQLEEFECYLTRLMELTGGESLAEVERLVCGRGERRFQLYTVLNRTQEALEKLKLEREAACCEEKEADENDSRTREVEQLQKCLLETQRSTLDHVQQAEFIRRLLDPVLPVVQSIFRALACDEGRIVAERGLAEISCETVNLYLAAVEQRLEEYVAAWSQQLRMRQRLKAHRDEVEVLSNGQLEPPNIGVEGQTDVIETDVAFKANGKKVVDENAKYAVELSRTDMPSALLN